MRFCLNNRVDEKELTGRGLDGRTWDEMPVLDSKRSSEFQVKDAVESSAERLDRLERLKRFGTSNYASFVES